MFVLFCIRKYLFPLLLALGGIYAAIRYSEACMRGITQGLSFSTSVLIPSLFLFMVLSAYLVKSGAAALLAKPFGFAASMAGLPREAAPALLMAAIGGYPVGAGCVALLHGQGQLSDSEAAKTALIAVAAGPGFVMNFVGRSLLQSRQAAGLLLLSQITALLLTGVILGRIVRCSPPPQRRRLHAASSGALVGAVRSAADATLTMCATVVLFAAVVEVIASVFDSGTADIISSFLEVTTGCSRLSTRVPLYLTAFFIGFGGLSVHCQIMAMLRDIPLNKPLFFLARVMQGIIAMAATYIFLMMVPMKTAVFSSSAAPLSADRSATYVGSGALILAALCFIGSVSSRIRRLKQCAE